MGRGGVEADSTETLQKMSVSLGGLEQKSSILFPVLWFPALVETASQSRTEQLPLGSPNKQTLSGFFIPKQPFPFGFMCMG